MYTEETHEDMGGPPPSRFVSSSTLDIPGRNTTTVGSPVYTHPTSPSPSKTKQGLAGKFTLGNTLLVHLKNTYM